MRKGSMTHELLGLASVFNLDNGLGCLVNNLEGPVLHVGLDLGVGELSANQSLGVENSVMGVHGDLVLGGITNESLRVVESDIRGGGSVTLVVGNDFDSVVLPDSDTGVGGTEINSNYQQLVIDSNGNDVVTYPTARVILKVV
jgi:hypothetical protein